MQSEKFLRTAQSLQYYANLFLDMAYYPTSENAAEALRIISSMQSNLNVQAYITQLLKQTEVK